MEPTYQVREWNNTPGRLDYDPGNGRRNPRWHRLETDDAPPTITARVVLSGGEGAYVALAGGWTMYKADGTRAHVRPDVAAELSRRMPAQWRGKRR